MPHAKATRATQLAADIRLSIIHGTLEPGARIRLDSLREHYGVSLSPLREAILKLVATGLVDAQDQRGNCVANVSATNLKEVSLVFGTLQVPAIQQSLENADLEWESRLLGATHLVERTAPGTTECIDAHSTFHRSLIENCPMPRLRDMCAAQLDLFSRYLHLFPSEELNAALSATHIRVIADAAIKEGAAATNVHFLSHIARLTRALNLTLTATNPEAKT